MLRVDVFADARSAADQLAVVVGDDPLGYTLPATVHADVLAGARHHPGALWLVVLDGDRPIGAAMRTPPHPLYVGPMPRDAAPLVADAYAEAIARTGVEPVEDLHGINGEAEAAAEVVRRWQQLFPQVSVTGSIPERLHRLQGLRVPDVIGEARVATQDDLGLLVPWHQAFAVDVGHPAVTIEHGLRIRLARHALLLWTVDGEPVSMAGHTEVVGGVTRVGPVYTPPGHRRHGFGAAVTAAASVAALAQPGARDAVLFTDLRNRTSNKIYAEIGYQPVRDYLEISLASAAARPRVATP